MLTEEQKNHLKEFGIDSKHLTEEECIDELLKVAHLLALTSEFTEKNFLKKEILKSLKPSN